MHPAGDCKIAQDEEPIEGLSWLAYRSANSSHLLSIAEGGRLRGVDWIEQTALAHLLAAANATLALFR